MKIDGYRFGLWRRRSLYASGLALLLTGAGSGVFMPNTAASISS